MTDRQKYGIYKNTDEAIEAWADDYVTNQQLRNLARKVNKGVQYALSTSKKSNITGYTVYRDMLQQVRATSAAEHIPDIIKSINKKTGEFKVSTAFAKYSPEQRQKIAGLLDYLGQNWAMSKSNWDYKQAQIARKSKNTMYKNHKNLSLYNYETMMHIFQSSFWQSIRKKSPYTESELEQMSKYADKVIKLDEGADRLTEIIARSSSMQDTIYNLKKFLAGKI